MGSALRRLPLLLFLSVLISFAANAQSPIEAGLQKKETRPYHVVTSGKQITIKSDQSLKHVMIWTTDGDRVMEQHGLHHNSCTLEVPEKKTYFLMVGLDNGSFYTEKIGLR